MNEKCTINITNTCVHRDDANNQCKKKRHQKNKNNIQNFFATGVQNWISEMVRNLFKEQRT